MAIWLFERFDGCGISVIYKTGNNMMELTPNLISKGVYEGLAAFAAKIVQAAGEITLSYFGESRPSEMKQDGSPVTEADRASERLLRRLIEQEYPAHGILGEELGLTNARSEFRWILDPLDGTVFFVRGIPLYAVMAGLVFRGEPVVGAIQMPVLQETVVAWKGGGAWWNGKRAQVSSVSSLDRATLLVTDPRRSAPEGKEAGFNSLCAKVRQEWGWGGGYGHVLVATGRAEVMLDPILHQWDVVPAFAILKEAGGAFATWSGDPIPVDRDTTSVATNAVLFETVIRALN